MLQLLLSMLKFLGSSLVVSCLVSGNIGISGYVCKGIVLFSLLVNGGSTSSWISRATPPPGGLAPLGFATLTARLNGVREVGSKYSDYRNGIR